MTGHKSWPPIIDHEKTDLWDNVDEHNKREMEALFAPARVQYDDKFKSMDRQAVQKRRARIVKDGLWALAAVAGFIAMLMVGGCTSTPTNTPWCTMAVRDARNACFDEYGPGRRGVTGYGHTDGYEYHCMMVAQAARRRCER